MNALEHLNSNLLVYKSNSLKKHSFLQGPLMDYMLNMYSRIQFKILATIKTQGQ